MITIDFEKMKEKLNSKRASERYLKDKQTHLIQLVKELSVDKEKTEKAKAFIQSIAEDTLKNLEFHLTTLPTSALHSIDPTAPNQIAEISIKRDQVECAFYFEEEGNEETKDKPIDSAGGGLLGIAGMANRIMMWSLNPNRPTWILDEPFKDLSPDLHRNASELLNKLVEDLGIQIIMVSHQEEIHSKADKIFKVTRKGNESFITET